MSVLVTGGTGAVDSYVPAVFPDAELVPAYVTTELLAAPQLRASGA